MLEKEVEGKSCFWACFYDKTFAKIFKIKFSFCNISYKTNLYKKIVLWKIKVMKKIISIISLGIMLFSGIQCSSPKTAEEIIKPEASIKEQVAKGAFLVDVRTPSEFASGSIKGAVNIPLDEVESRVNEFKGKPSVIVFCRSGNRSSQAKSILEANGITNVTNGINVEHVNDELLK
jgi:rhodanese-related sulfurtransferase